MLHYIGGVDEGGSGTAVYVVHYIGGVDEGGVEQLYTCCIICGTRVRGWSSRICAALYRRDKPPLHYTLIHSIVIFKSRGEGAAPHKTGLLPVKGCFS